MTAHTAVPVASRYERLTVQLICVAFFNLFLVSCLGLLLRALPFVQLPLDYKNILHGHSHFAFGGWIMPMLLGLILKVFPEVTQRVALRHWRAIAVLLFVSAYGMLVAFPLQGYKAVSIFFSTVSVAAGYYLIVVLWKALNQVTPTVSTRFLKTGLFYLGVSAVGPFATGPLIILGYQGTPLYFDALYFYLHFQYNGWFLFAVLALLYKTFERSGTARHGNAVFHLFNVACIPAYALSMLWHNPPLVFNMIGGLAALLQVVAFFYLLRDVPVAFWRRSHGLYVLATTALGVKVVLQLASAVPVVAALGYTYSNFIIAYLHLVLLGCISIFLFAFVCSLYPKVVSPLFKTGFRLFLFSFLTTETLLVLQAAGTLVDSAVPHIALWLFLFSLFFPVGMLAMSMGVLKSLGKARMAPWWRKDVSIA